jgi:hypothetical protein
MALLVLAGCNMTASHRIGTREIARWDAAGGTPVAAKTLGGISLLGLDRGGGVRPLDRLHIALVRPPGYFLANAPHLDCVKATYAIPTPSDICCVRLDRGG